MSSLRICPGCKWKYPKTYNKPKCRFCGTPFDTKMCTICKELKPRIDFHGSRAECKECNIARRIEWGKENPERHREYTRVHDAKRRRIAEELMEKWLVDTTTQFKPLSEREWLDACAFFGGCAICDSEYVETRQFFIPFQSGGRYSPWNVFPMCGKCSTITRKQKNPFIWLDSRFGGATVSLGITEDKRQRLIDYFTSKVAEAIE